MPKLFLTLLLTAFSASLISQNVFTTQTITLHPDIGAGTTQIYTYQVCENVVNTLNGDKSFNPGSSSMVDTGWNMPNIILFALLSICSILFTIWKNKRNRQNQNTLDEIEPGFSIDDIFGTQQTALDHEDALRKIEELESENTDLKKEISLLKGIPFQETEPEIEIEEHEAPVLKNKHNYACDEGQLTIEQEYPNPNFGELAFLNNTPAPTGKYKLGFLQWVYIKDGKVAAES
jgi:hypothetical protein